MTARLNGFDHVKQAGKRSPRRFCVNCEHHSVVKKTAATEIYCMHPTSAEQGPLYLVDGIRSPYLCVDMRQSGRCGVEAQFFQPKTTENET